MSIFKNGVWSWGFDNTTTPLHIFSTQSGGFCTISSAFTRYPAVTGAVAQGAQFNPSGSNCFASIVLGTQLQSMIVGIAMKPNLYSGAGDCSLLSWYDGTTTTNQVTLSVSTTGALTFRRGTSGGTLLATTGAAQIPLNAFSYIECTVKIDPSNGFVECRQGGSTIMSLNGINTRNSANSFTDTIVLGPSNGAPTIVYDDWYMLDQTGAGPLATYLGDVRIRTYPPNADSATVGLNAFSTSPSQGVGSHFQNVKEVPPDDGTTINFDGTPNDRESYRYPGYNGASIYFVNAWARLQKDDGNSRSVAIVGRNGGVDTIGSTITSPAGYTYFNQTFTVDPATGLAWTPGGFGTGASSSFEAGLKVIS